MKMFESYNSEPRSGLKKRVLKKREEEKKIFEKAFFSKAYAYLILFIARILNADQSYERAITLNHLDKCWQERVTSNRTPSSEYEY